MGACVVAINAVSVALLAISALEWKGDSRAEDVDTAVVFLQLLAFCGEPRCVIPTEIVYGCVSVCVWVLVAVVVVVYVFI